MPAKILNFTSENIQIAAEALSRGEVVGMPTETVYGLAGDAFNPQALAKIFSTKERPTFDPLILHVEKSVQSLQGLVDCGLVDADQLSEIAQDRIDRLITAFWPGPLTLVLPKNKNVPDLATSGLPSVAIRMPEHPVAQALLSACKTPLAAPSANRFGRISPTSAQDVFDELGDRIGWILDGGRCNIGVESTILSVSLNGELTVLRPGGLALEKIEEKVSAKIKRSAIESVPKNTPALAPGMLESHYAPSKKLTLLPFSLSNKFRSVENLDPENPDMRKLRDLLASAKTKNHTPNFKIAIMTFSGDSSQLVKMFSTLLELPIEIFCLSPQGSIEEAAQNLFHTLRAMDQSSCEILWSEPCEIQHGLGHAIADRLRRASS